MIDIKGGKKEQVVRQWFNDAKEGVVPAKTKVLDLFQEFDSEDRSENISYGLFNGVMKKIIAEGHVGKAVPGSESGGGPRPSADSVETHIVAVEDMEFPDFALHTTGKKIDELFSDHEKGGGLYGGTVNIVIGESGVGKSTVLLDVLASVRAANPDAKVLYISSEMTKNDIGFYYKKTPAIGRVPTLLLMEHVKDGTLDIALEKEFNAGHDIILLDSYQDCIVKLKESLNWRSTKAESWLTNMMIDAAEKGGCAVLAIQHMTKGGQYVGSTYLKHATTAMMEILFDITGQRYIEFSKNRRGGSGVGKRLYYRLNENGDVVYDSDRFEETKSLMEIEEKESVRQSELNKKFEDMFLGGSKAKDSVEEPVEEEEGDE